MISDLESSYKKLRAQNETLSARIEVAEEKLAELYKDLNDTFNCKTLEEAEALRKKLEAAKSQLEKQIEESLASVLH